MVKKIILDCDPGHDDAIAMLLAHGNPEIELLAVTTVVGNQTLEKVTRNALAVARVINLTGVPFAAGATRPLVRQVEIADEIRGVRFAISARATVLSRHPSLDVDAAGVRPTDVKCAFAQHAIRQSQRLHDVFFDCDRE